MAPSSTAQAKPKRETMLSRSERIIGRLLKDDTQKNEQAKEALSTQDATSKRRGQVLKAQRNHRRRTQNYILELENEVLRLRKREAEMAAELDLLRSQIKNGHQTQLSGLLNSNSGSDTLSEPHTRESPMVTVDLSDYARVEAGYPCTKAALGIEPAFTTPASSMVAAIGNKDSDAEDMFTTDAQSAIDFILDFERPCLSHIKYDLTTKLPTPFTETNINHGRNHSCTASARIIQTCPNTDWATQKIQFPQQIIENLLKNSNRLPLGPEMTPVQVWQLLIEIGKEQNISATRVEFLRKELHKYMRCNAFGSSIPIEPLKRLLNIVFPWYNTDHLRDIHAPVAEPELDIMNEAIGSDWEQYF